MMNIGDFGRFKDDAKINLKLTGTTTVGLVCRDGVILGADRRATSGFYIAHPHVKKLYRLDDHIAATIAGVVADAQQIMEIAASNIKLYKYRVNRPITVRGAATFLSNILANSRVYPYVIQVLVGGVDSTGPRLFSLDPYGTLTEEKFTATGSGSPTALGVLEDAFKMKMSVDEVVPIVARAIQAAMSRDPASGGGFDIVIITRGKIKEIPSEKIKLD